MADTITLTGVVATDPRPLNTKDALPITAFRLASNQRRFDRSTQTWVDGDTNWYSVTAFRQLALNSNTSIRKGDRVIVTGRLRIREWDNGTKKGTAVEVDALTIGHDLSWGTASFTKNSAPAGAASRTDAESAAEAARPENELFAPDVDGADNAAERDHEETGESAQAMALTSTPF